MSMERRRHPRVRLGVPVRIYFLGERRPATLELVDLSASGGGFKTTSQWPGIGQRAAFGFVMPDRSVCLARGRVVRVDREGFAVALDRTNPGFRKFLGDISGPTVVAAAA